MRIAWTDTASRDLDGFHPSEVRRIHAKIERFAAVPRSLVRQVKRLKGSPYSRLRVGDYRVIFRLDRGTMLIARVGHRRDVYE